MVASVTLATTMLLTACGGGAADVETASVWQEPAWVAQFRQDMEEFQLAKIACYADFGIEVVKDPAGGIGLPETDGELLSDAWIDLLESAGLECLERVGSLSWAHLPVDEEAYQRMVDARDCLVAHGHHVSEPPTFEVWRQDVHAWTPHGDLFDNLTLRQGIRISAAEWATMNAECPQPAQHLFSVSGLQ